MKTMIDGKIWNDPDFESVMDFKTIGVYIYLMTNESCNTIGMYRLNLRKATHDTRLEVGDFHAALSELESETGGKKIHYCDDTKWLWVIGLFKHNMKAIKNKSIAKSVLSMVDSVEQEGCPYASPFRHRYATSLSLVKHQCDTIIGIGTDKGTEEYSKGFLSFWEHYPLKVKKPKAWEAWQKKGCESICIKIIDAIKAQAVAQGWKGVKGDYTPHPATWLNGSRWDDEISEPVNNGRPTKVSL